MFEIAFVVEVVVAAAAVVVSKIKHHLEQKKKMFIYISLITLSFQKRARSIKMTSTHSRPEKSRGENC